MEEYLLFVASRLTADIGPIPPTEDPMLPIAEEDTDPDMPPLEGEEGDPDMPEQAQEPDIYIEEDLEILSQELLHDGDWIDTDDLDTEQ